MDKKVNLSDNLSKLNTIATWFDDQEKVDIEEGLKKVQEAAILIKESKTRLSEIENSFKEIQSDLDYEDSETREDLDDGPDLPKQSAEENSQPTTRNDDSLDDLPF